MRAITGMSCVALRHFVTPRTFLKRPGSSPDRNRQNRLTNGLKRKNPSSAWPDNFWHCVYPVNQRAAYIAPYLCFVGPTDRRTCVVHATEIPSSRKRYTDESATMPLR